MSRKQDMTRQCKYETMGGRCGKFHGHGGFHEVDARYDLPVNSKTARAQRARHAARMFKQGIRLFRFGSPEGPTFCVETIWGDEKHRRAVGHVSKRKTVQIVPLHDLWPETAC